MYDNIATQPAWAVPDNTALVMTLSSSDITLMGTGTHTVQITTTYAALAFTDTQTVTVTFVIPCSLTTWNAATLVAQTTTVSAIPSLAYAFAPFTTLATACGTITYVLSPAYAWAAVNSATNTITIATSQATDVGAYTITVSGTLDAYPLIPALSVTMAVTINAC